MQDSRPIGIIERSKNYAEMVIDWLLDHLKVPPRDIIFITPGANRTRVDELRARKVNVRTGVDDFLDETALIKAFTGIKRLLITSIENVEYYENSYTLQTTEMKIAAEVGVKHIIFLTSPTPCFGQLVPTQDIKIESFLKGLQSITYTLLAESITNEFLYYMIREFVYKGIYYTQNRAGAVSHVAMKDSALIAAIILSSSSNQFQNQKLDVTGPAVLTREQVAQSISKRIRKNLTVIEVSEERLIEEFMAVGYTEYDANLFTRYDSSFVSGLYNRVCTRTCNDIADKEPTSFEDWLLETPDDWLAGEHPFQCEEI